MCLSDAAKRKTFDSKRSKNFCFECNRIPYTSKKVPVPGTGSSNGSCLKTRNMSGGSRSYKVWRNIKEMREMLKEEAKVIENCLRANLMSKKESPLYDPADYRDGSRFMNKVEREVPVFNPMKYLYQGYPHLRDHVHQNCETCWYFDTQNLVHNEKREAKYGSPVFEVRSQSKFGYDPSWFLVEFSISCFVLQKWLFLLKFNIQNIIIFVLLFCCVFDTQNVFSTLKI